MNLDTTQFIVGSSALAILVRKVVSRLQLSRAKHPSLAGHARIAKRIARQIPFYEYDEGNYFCIDGAPKTIADQRHSGFMRLAEVYAQRFVQTVALTKESAAYISDLQFTSHYRVPYQFSRLVRQFLASGSFLQESNGVTVTDLDGNTFYDLTGSYGVNVFGYDFYKGCIDRGAERARKLGPVLGGYHPLVASNIKRLCKLSGMDEVSFHMSGTEAVMQAVRLARYHTQRTHIVRLCGAYHGWWGDVQPGVGNPVAEWRTYTLKDMDADTLQVLRTRKDIACILVNPLQALHPNNSAPSDSTLVDSSRTAGFDRERYASWLRALREVCTNAGIALIFDEVFMGFRLAAGGAQEFFGVQADMVTYGKTLGGGLPVGVVCGRAHWMKRFRSDRPIDVCFARGTFNSHPYVMATMHEFLEAIEAEDIKNVYGQQSTVWDKRAAKLNAQLEAYGLPIQVRNMCSVWTVTYTVPSNYNWMLQFYLREQGLALSWVGTGRFIFSLNYTDSDFEAVSERIIRATQNMYQDGWWWEGGNQTNKLIKRRIMKEIAKSWIREKLNKMKRRN